MAYLPSIEERRAQLFRFWKTVLVVVTVEWQSVTMDIQDQLMLQVQWLDMIQ